MANTNQCVRFNGICNASIEFRVSRHVEKPSSRENPMIPQLAAIIPATVIGSLYMVTLVINIFLFVFWNVIKKLQTECKTDTFILLKSRFHF